LTTEAESADGSFEPAEHHGPDGASEA
jgi:hypothetical protein